MSDERAVLVIAVEKSGPLLECDLCSAKQRWDAEYVARNGDRVYLSACDDHLGRILSREVLDELGDE